MINFVTVAELNQDILGGIYKLPRDLDLIVGVPRSGMLPATLIALYLNKPLCDLETFTKGSIYASGKTNTVKDLGISDIRKVLVVEDSSNSGSSIKRAKELIEKNSIAQKEIVYLAIYVTEISRTLVDIFFREVPYPRVFEWNYLNHDLLKEACMDIDGVLCNDPLPEENDDGEKYIAFLENAKPRYLPTRRVDCLVTSRLEKYREITERWLKENGVQYNELIMMGGYSASERRKLGNHGNYKAEVFSKRREDTWFIESERKQAEEIAKITGKAVFCVNSRYFFPDNEKRIVHQYIKRRIKWILLFPAKTLLSEKCYFNLRKRFLKR